MSTTEILELLPKLARSEREKILHRLEELALAEMEETPEMLAALDAGRRSLREGKRHTVEEARQYLAQWVTRLAQGTRYSFFMKTLLPFFLIPLLGLFSALPSLAQEGIDQDLTQKISTFLTECEKIKPGMTRADLLKVFTTEGGLSTAAERTYVYRSCRCLKVDVKFSLSSAGQNVLEEKPTDTISKISPPYVQWMVLD